VFGRCLARLAVPIVAEDRGTSKCQVQAVQEELNSWR